MTQGKASMDTATAIAVHPVTPELWPDLEALFGEHGAHAGCWCMFWRVNRTEFNRLKGEGRKAALRALAEAGAVPGVLAYADGTPVGWCSIGPREDFAALERSRALKRLDDAPVWSIVCFFVAKGFRRRGVMTALLRGAVAYAAQRGAGIVEAYPLDTEAPQVAGKRLTGCTGYMGIASPLRAAGFVEVARASATQPIMRYTI